MSRTLKILLGMAGLALLSTGSLRADDSSDSDEGKLRDVLRNTMIQLRGAQTDLANLQATQATEAEEKKNLDAQLVLLRKNAAEDRALAEKEAESLKAKQAEQEKEISELQQSLANWKSNAEKANAAYKATDAERARQSATAVALERRVEDLEARNAALERLGNEILDRYAKFSLGEQFLAREPFIGRTRVELENLVQDYQDKLLNQRATAPAAQ
jgi:chromosome segregation ATPase